MKPALVVKNLSVSYPSNPQPVVKSISFALQPGTINMLIGPNGSGKSTVLKAIIGTLPYSGKISLFGDYHIGYVPQRLGLDLSMPINVKEFLMLTLLVCYHTAQEKKEFIDQALDKVNAHKFAHKTLGQLSGGQLQRVILARALVHKPKLLLLDEPESGIDVVGERLIYDVLKKLVAEEDLTVLIATHELEMVYTYADQVLCLNKSLVCHGNPHKILTKKAFEKLYGKHKHQVTHVS